MARVLGLILMAIGVAMLMTAAYPWVHFKFMTMTPRRYHYYYIASQGSSLTWLWISGGAALILAGGFALSMLRTSD
jgi:hypothetical protein